jgi:hypothetical protein
MTVTAPVLDTNVTYKASNGTVSPVVPTDVKLLFASTSGTSDTWVPRCPPSRVRARTTISTALRLPAARPPVQRRDRQPERPRRDRPVVPRPVGQPNGTGGILNGYAKNDNYDDRVANILPPYLFDISNSGWQVSRETICTAGSTSTTYGCQAPG